jgi:hypothetical protein
VKLKEGEVFSFFVEKEIRSPDNSRYYVLSGPDRKRYLIPVLTYKDYEIVPGKKIKCRIDRINCKGEVFLEPSHPYYSEGKSYLFKVTGRDVRTDNAGKNLDVLIVADKLGNKIPVLEDRLKYKKGSFIRLTVERISKGKLFLDTGIPESGKAMLKTGKEYNFFIERIGTGMDDREYFIIRDPYGGHHSVDKGYYEHYGLKTGIWFKGFMAVHKPGGDKLIEPVNPFYTAGEKYLMKVERITENQPDESFTVELIDQYGFNHCIEMGSPPDSDTITCRVERIRKGRPVLEPM